uniref:Uncharacterized protein n=1 Tax=Cacopsylla melanoneura TaxID=428564 RepID=A0A8D8SP01_9HEMI
MCAGKMFSLCYQGGRRNNRQHSEYHLVPGVLSGGFYISRPISRNTFGMVLTKFTAKQNTPPSKITEHPEQHGFFFDFCSIIFVYTTVEKNNKRTYCSIIIILTLFIHTLVAFNTLYVMIFSGFCATPRYF